MLIGGIGLVLLLSLGIVGTLWLAGVPLNPFAAKTKDDPFMVRIPINVQPIPAYTRVDRTQMINPATGGLMFQNVPPASTVGLSIVGIDQNGSHAEGRIEAVKNVRDEVVFVLSENREVRQAQTFEIGGALISVNSIIGRVVKKDKRAGLGFSESTFFPQGTPEGIAGATPPGMRAITLDATKLTGVHALGAGDQIDLMASFPVGESPSESSSLASPNPSSAGKSDDRRCDPHLLAQNAVVLKPVYVRNEASTSASLTQGTRVQNIPKYEVAIAVKPDDLIPLQRALNQSLSITCIAHSMKPAGDEVQAVQVTDSEMVSVPVTVRPVLAYNVVTREAFVSPATRTLKMDLMPRSQVARMDVITALDEALGAIAKHDIPAGHFLRRSDLLSGPPGQEKSLQPGNGQSDAVHTIHAHSSSTRLVSTLQEEQHQHTTQSVPQSSLASASTATAVGDRPAISRFTPAGMKSFSIPWNRVYGSEHLQIGDRIDLMVSYPLQRLRTVVEQTKNADGSVTTREYETLDFTKTDRTVEESFGNRGEPWFVVTDAVVIGPVGFPAPASAQRELADPDNKSAGRGSKDRSGVTLVGPPVIIAVADQDAENFAAALVTNEALFSVAVHSESSEMREGMKEIALCPVAIQAYELFDEAVWNNNRRKMMSRMVATNDPRFAKAIDSSFISNYFGRTLANAKSRWDFFTTEDFFEEGVRPGVAAAARPGYSIALIPDDLIENLAEFKTEDIVTILIRNDINLPFEVIYTGLHRNFPRAQVVSRNVRIVRRAVAGRVAIELPDCEAAVLQAAIATTPNSTRQERSGNDNRSKGEGFLPSLVAVAQPRVFYGKTKVLNHAYSAVQSFDALDGLRFMDFVIGRDRTTYAFDADHNSVSECDKCDR